MRPPFFAVDRASDEDGTVADLLLRRIGWAQNKMIERRFPHQVGKAIAKGINNGASCSSFFHPSTPPVGAL